MLDSGSPVYPKEGAVYGFVCYVLAVQGAEAKEQKPA